MFYLDGHPPPPTLELDIERLRALVCDLERARSGDHPSHRLVASAPVLDNWQLAFRREPCLIGTVTGHPAIKNGHGNLTSSLWLFAPAFGYARTLSRFYALGRPATDRG